ncbi:hypothetical protein XIS1_1560047 [Xenorhabdus innexi]|uniref:Uncharacterized protein n=1 Tax=Xenorhabdus innexi TaxID=290109 RepID=A0A1N6MUN5_9GAMM|nr:hypothetical protein XIS1_1560047 [Xenorhabdus innexi]
MIQLILMELSHEYIGNTFSDNTATDTQNDHGSGFGQVSQSAIY